MDLKDELTELHGKLEALETKARELENQNLADIAMTAKGRVEQLANHPDLHLVADEKPVEQPTPFPKTVEPVPGNQPVTHPNAPAPLVA